MLRIQLDGAHEIEAKLESMIEKIHELKKTISAMNWRNGNARICTAHRHS